MLFIGKDRFDLCLMTFFIATYEHYIFYEHNIYVMS